MNKVLVDIQNCYGIKKLQQQFDFTQKRAYAIYAPNGAMKSSFAQTFKDVAEGKASRDRIFPARTSAKTITDEAGIALQPSQVLVIALYDQVFGHTEKTSTLLVNAALRQEYEQLHLEIDKAEDRLLKALRQQSHSKRDIAKEISATFTKSEEEFHKALIRVKDELLAQKDAPFADVEYDGALDQQRPQIDVAGLGNAQLRIVTTGLASSRPQAGITTHIATSLESLLAAQGQHIRQRRKLTDAIDLDQSLCLGILSLCESLDEAIIILDLQCQRSDLIKHRAERLDQPRRHYFLAPLRKAQRRGSWQPIAARLRKSAHCFTAAVLKRISRLRARISVSASC